ncbi:DUF1534 domain-containing protein [Pseudomonas viridiflava]|uniref:DUF1534 domain-containing protein n=1 Tax=Pseudomonas viridiflava TaxID=33069 RepID=A0AA46W180_PSEVI|nr:DUF1534 domain-containing protein [Pseudomonas viridiflava]
MKKSLIVTTLQRGNASRDAPRHKADAERQGPACRRRALSVIHKSSGCPESQRH